MVLMRSLMTERRAVAMLRSVDLGSQRRSMPMFLCLSILGLGEVLLVALGEFAVVVAASFEF